MFPCFFNDKSPISFEIFIFDIISCILFIVNNLLKKIVFMRLIKNIVCYISKRTNLIVFVLWLDRKSTRLNSSHVSISYAVFCLKKKKKYNKVCITKSM